MFFAQGALVNWRKRHRRSYDLATLVGLWLIPPIIAVQLGEPGACKPGSWAGWVLGAAGWLYCLPRDTLLLYNRVH